MMAAAMPQPYQRVVFTENTNRRAASAIDYVVNEEQPKMYLLEGHGEKELPASFKEQIEKENIQLDQLSLLNVDSVPEDADGIMIYGPSSDISEAEKEILSSYTKNG